MHLRERRYSLYSVDDKSKLQSLATFREDTNHIIMTSISDAKKAVLCQLTCAEDLWACPRISLGRSFTHRQGLHTAGLQSHHLSLAYVGVRYLLSMSALGVGVWSTLPLDTSERAAYATFGDHTYSQTVRIGHQSHTYTPRLYLPVASANQKATVIIT